MMQLYSVQTNSSQYRIHILNLISTGIEIYDDQFHFTHQFRTIDEFLRFSNRNNPILIMLTGPVPPGTSERIQRQVNPQNKVVYCPFLLVKKMNLRCPNNRTPFNYHVLGGNDFKALHFSRRWLGNIFPPEETPILITSFRNAELIWHTRKSFYREQQKILYSLWRRCLNEKADIITILRAMKLDFGHKMTPLSDPIFPLLSPLYPTGHSDVHSWLKKQLLKTCAYNPERSEKINIMVWSHPGNIPMLQKWIIQIFKNDIVNKANLRIKVWPINNVRQNINGQFHKRPSLNEADLLIIAGNNEILQRLPPETFMQEMRCPKIIDLYGIYHPLEMERRGISYISPWNP